MAIQNRSLQGRADSFEPALGFSKAEASSPLELISNAINGIRYGEVRVVIHDGQVVQIERLEKQRLR